MTVNSFAFIFEAFLIKILIFYYQKFQKNIFWVGDVLIFYFRTPRAGCLKDG